MSKWTPVTEQPPSLEPDGIPYVLTRAEKSQVALYRCMLIERKKRQNEADKAKQEAKDAAEAYKLGLRL